MSASVSVKEGAVSDNALYVVGVDLIKHTKDKRDEINKFFVSLFSIGFSVVPFLMREIKLPYFEKFNLIMIGFSVFGTVLSISWVLMLRYTKLFLNRVENMVEEIERRNGVSFFGEIKAALRRPNTPERVTSQEMYLSYLFLLVFVVLFIISIGLPYYYT